jgi:hypothetical protein
METDLKNVVNIPIGSIVLHMSSSADIFWYGQARYKYLYIGNTKVTNKHTKKDCVNEINKTIYKEGKIGMTAFYTSQPNKVLFFAYPHFYLIIANPDCPNWHEAHVDTQTKAFQRVQSL